MKKRMEKNLNSTKVEATKTNTEMPKTKFYLGDRVNIDGDELILARFYNKDDEKTLIFQLISTIDGNRFSDKAVVIAKKDRDGAQWITRTEMIYLLEGDGGA